jgi:hypothetical protein
MRPADAANQEPTAVTTPQSREELSHAVKDDIQALKQEEFPRQTPDTKLFNGRSLKELKD